MFFGLLILVLAMLVTYLCFRVLVGQGRRDAVVSCWLAIALFVFLSTEVLSLLQWFKPVPLTCAWILLLFVLTILMLRRRKDAASLCLRDISFLWAGCKYLYVNYRISFFSVAVILVLTFVHALVAPSFDVDALGYHLPRATHWLVNGSVSFYETAIARQNFQAPLYSFFVAHVMALTQSDLFLNLIQWLAFVVNAVVLSLIAKELKVGRRGQWLVAVLSFCIPQAISQVLVCVNDLFATTAVMVFVFYLIRFLNSKDINLGYAAQASMAMGIAFLIKYTSLIHVAGFAIPLSVIGLIKIWKICSFKQMSKYAGMLGLIALVGTLFLLPQATRNMRYYGDPLSGEPPNLMTNVNLTPGKLVVNYVRHAAMHIAMPFYVLNRPVESVVRELSGDLIEDPDITYSNNLCFTDYKIFTPLGKYSSNASNPVQFVLYVLLLLMMVFSGFKGAALSLEYSVAPVLFGSVVYALIFKWQPWCSRLQLPYFMLMMVGIVLWLEKRKNKIMSGRVIAFCALGYALLHIALFSDWYMPAFLYGTLPESSGYGPRASLVQKIRYLHNKGWPLKEIEYMQKSVPESLAKGYSIFLTERNRLYIGNQYHDDMYYLYDDCLECVGYLESEVEGGCVSPNIGMIISSDHGNIFPETASYANRPFSWEFLLWKISDNVTGEKPLKFKHFAKGDLRQLATSYFGEKEGLVLSDYSRESVLTKLKQIALVEQVFSNRVFSVYSVNLKQ